MQIVKTTLLLCLLAFVACKQDPKQAAQNTSPEAAAAQPDVILYCVNVDNLQLRDQPSLTGAVVTKFPEGSFVTGTGEKSTSKVEVDLRGIPYTDYFFKVTNTAPEAQNGWAFGGALTPVYHGPKSGSPDLTKLATLSAFLKPLNTKDIKSGKKAWDFVTANFADATGATADAVYILLSHFVSRMEYEGEFYSMTEKIKWTNDDFDAIYKDKFDMNKYPLTKSLAENGFRVETAEGMVFPTADWQKSYDFFSGKVTPAFKSWLDQELKESKSPDSEDGGMIITPAELAERAAFWEKFNTDNPKFVMTDRSIYSEQWMRGVLIGGMDNTPIYEWESKKVNEDFKKAWLDVQQKYPGTKLAQVCKESCDIWAANGWKYTEAVEKWHTAFVERNAQ